MANGNRPIVRKCYIPLLICIFLEKDPQVRNTTTYITPFLIKSYQGSFLYIVSLDEIRIIQKATTVSSTLDSECVFKPFSRQSALANKNISSTILPSSPTERLISIAANGLMDFTAIKSNRIDSKS